MLHQSWSTGWNEQSPIKNITETNKCVVFFDTKYFFTALKSDRSERILNNYWILSPPGRYPAAGTVFEYFQGGAHPSCPGQCIFAAGPTSESVTVQVISLILVKQIQ